MKSVLTNKPKKFFCDLKINNDYPLSKGNHISFVNIKHIEWTTHEMDLHNVTKKQ